MTDQADTTLDGPWGPLHLHRLPYRPRSGLRAWDAADAHALQHLADRGAAPQRCLVVGDRYGAIGIALAQRFGDAEVTIMADSSLAHRGAETNAVRNGLAADRIGLATSLDQPVGPLDLVVLRVPRSLAMLEDQLRRIRPALGPDSTVLGTGMAKHVHTSTLQCIERFIGPTTTSRAWRRARLIHVTPDPGLDPGPSPFPVVHPLPGGLDAVSHAGVFAHGRVDHGTRLLLEHLPVVPDGAEVVDLGCGDGVVGLTIAAAQPTAQLTFTDESHMAVQSAREGWQRAFGADRPARFLLGDGMDAVADTSIDVVVVNPPFHDDHATGDAIAWDMFTGARRALRPGGRLIVVGNRHLGYHAKLARLFGGSTTLASNAKFVVLQSIRKEPRS
ncbi:methyltransferase [soil metagenome]